MSRAPRSRAVERAGRTARGAGDRGRTGPDRTGPRPETTEGPESGARAGPVDLAAGVTPR